ncbi:hypothetical protein [Nocardioides marmorisolisilvae]|uniref:WD40 repeat domain-containing protein n=1 Tax=Nocardioides marmorisolisilvae TaxID=1542737 RepID=A0A3N0E124_9ACTN|nr:hypothetical protein [Nocardioides marmorisolisilvae]RNL81443.1 hypothetical protein EFL95_03685 [Nocardioides marmorisolisilvae]
MPEPTLDDLRSVLQQHADRPRVPDLPLDSLQEQLETHRHGRRRRAAIVAVLAAAAAAVVVVTVPGLGVRHDSGNPAPATNLPTPTPTADGFRLPRGGPPEVAYTAGTQLFVPGPDGPTKVVLDGQPTSLHQAGNTLMVNLDENRVRVFTFGSKSDLVDEPATGASVLSGDGRYAAWVKPGGGKPVVVVRRLDGTQPADRSITFPVAPAADDPLRLVGITTDGRLLAWMGGQMATWVWDFAHGGDVVEVRKLENPRPQRGQNPGLGIVQQVIGNRFVVQYDGGGHDLGDIAPDGLWKPEARNPDDGAASLFGETLFSPDGKSAVEVQGSNVFAYVGASAYELPLPDGTTEAAATFESDTRVLFALEPDAENRTVVVRCTAPAETDSVPGGCEQAAVIQGSYLLPQR